MSRVEQSNERIGAKYVSDLPRRWEKLSLGEACGLNSGGDLDIDIESLRRVLENSHLPVDDVSTDQAEQAVDAFEELISTSEVEIFKRHSYDGEELRERPSEIFLRAVDEEDYTSEAYKLREPDISTRKNQGLDDRIDDVEVLYQVTFGEEGASAHMTNRNSEANKTVGDLSSFFKDIFKGKDNAEWEEHCDTGFWKSYADPSPIELYNVVPERVDPFMDNYLEFVDEIRGQSKSAPYHLHKENYGELSELLDISEEGLENIFDYAEGEIDEGMRSNTFANI